MIICTVCGEPFWPTGRWRGDVCPWCNDANFAASQELHVHDAAAPLTPRERAALELLQRVQDRREDEHAL
jgi:hypothetical protein